ncbi:hypothetical protein UMZ34_02475 [Halopseudomonas pachastrellae]|nr:hypothetical protein UMZ34_02475 [Halopseudomonas pachastrellae]
MPPTACARPASTLLNQAVLLRGVNDTLSAQIALSEALGDSGVLPYYLHLLDHVRGASHFLVPDNQAQELVGRLLTRLPGYGTQAGARDRRRTRQGSGQRKPGA